MRQLAVRATKWHYLVRHIAGHCGNKIHVLCQCEARLTLNSYFIKIPLAKVGTLRDGTVLLFVCSFVLSVACEICKVIRYVAALDGERGLFASSLIHLL